MFFMKRIYIRAYKAIACGVFALALLACAVGCQNFSFTLPTFSLPTGSPQVTLVINEVVTSNSLSLTDPALGSPDWIELYNATGNDMDLTGYGLSDNIKEPHKWVFPETTLRAGGYILVYAAKQSNTGALCTGFGLSKKGETLFLTDAYYNVLQQLEIPALPTDISYARGDDGLYGYCSAPTPMEANHDVVYAGAPDASAPASQSGLTLTEVMPRASSSHTTGDGSSYPWAELYNTSDQALLLSDYYLSDAIGEPNKCRLPEVTLNAGEYAVVWFAGSERTLNDELFAAMRLGKNDTLLCLADGRGAIVTMLDWPQEIPEGVCVLAEGGYTAAATPGAANGPAEFNTLQFSNMDASAPIRINEVLLHNAYSLRDDTGERTAWAELYNGSLSAVSLGGYYLSDSPDAPFKWAFPQDVSIEPGAYLLVFLSGKAQTPGGALHTPFKLSRSDEALVLTDSSSLGQDTIPLPPSLGSNVSIGRATDGSFVYYTTPTPGAANTTHAQTEPLASDYTDMQNIYISEVSAVSPAKSRRADWIELHNASSSAADLSGWAISDSTDDLARYTIASLTIPAGGYATISAASASSKGASAPFGISSAGETLLLSDKNGNLRDIFRTGALRLGLTSGRNASSANRVFYLGSSQNAANAAESYTGFVAEPMFSSLSLYHTAPFSLSLSSLTRGASLYYTLNGSKPDTASMPYTGPIPIEKNTVLRAIAYADGLLPSDVVTATFLFEQPHTVPVVCLAADSADWNTLYSVTLRENRTEREGHFSFYEADGALGTAFGCGLRASGSSTLLARQKSLAVYLRGAYGQGDTSYPFFADCAVSTFSSLVLRNSGQDRDKTRIRDSLFSRLVKGLRVDNAETRIVVVYVNGQYWGIYDLNENQNEDYLAAYYGVDPDAVDIIRRNVGALSGRNTDFKRVRAYGLNTDLSDDARFAEFTNWVDTEYFTDYLIAQTYFANGDMFNQKYWRSQDYAVKWRPVFYDLDLALSGNNPSRNILPSYFKAAGVPSQDGSLTNMDIFVGLRKNKSWCEQFGARYVYVVRNQFAPARIDLILDDMTSSLKAELPRHITRWGAPSSLASWEKQIADLRACLHQRADYALKALQREFNFTDAQMAQWEAAAKA
jgi:hypothetical protein